VKLISFMTTYRRRFELIHRVADGKVGFATTLAAMIALMASGCGSRTGTVSGKVTYHGQPLTSGLVIFVAADER
jgi:hypothetical protein